MSLIFPLVLWRFPIKGQREGYSIGLEGKKKQRFPALFFINVFNLAQALTLMF